MDPTPDPTPADPLPDTVTADAAPPADPEIDAFDAVCRRLSGFDETLDAEYVDGWLTAVAAGPRRIGLDEWLPKLAGDSFERAFADPADVAQATEALAARAARIAKQLDPERLLDDDQHLHLGPLMQQWDDASRQSLVDDGHVDAETAATLLTGAIWAEGFFAAVEAFPADWAEPADDADRDDLRTLLRTVALLADDPASDEHRNFVKGQWKDADPTRDELIDEACFAVQDLRLWWLDHMPKPPPRRVEATPGRNDPCFCGSGKKYKRCHGAAA